MSFAQQDRQLAAIRLQAFMSSHGWTALHINPQDMRVFTPSCSGVRLTASQTFRARGFQLPDVVCYTLQQAKRITLSAAEDISGIIDIFPAHAPTGKALIRLRTPAPVLSQRVAADEISQSLALWLDALVNLPVNILISGAERQTLLDTARMLAFQQRGTFLPLVSIDNEGELELYPFRGLHLRATAFENWQQALLQANELPVRRTIIADITRIPSDYLAYQTVHPWTGCIPHPTPVHPIHHIQSVHCVFPLSDPHLDIRHIPPQMTVHIQVAPGTAEIQQIEALHQVTADPVTVYTAQNGFEQSLEPCWLPIFLETVNALPPNNPLKQWMTQIQRATENNVVELPLPEPALQQIPPLPSSDTRPDSRLRPVKEMAEFYKKMLRHFFQQKVSPFPRHSSDPNDSPSNPLSQTTNPAAKRIQFADVVATWNGIGLFWPLVQRESVCSVVQQTTAGIAADTANYRSHPNFFYSTTEHAEALAWLTQQTDHNIIYPTANSGLPDRIIARGWPTHTRLTAFDDPFSLSPLTTVLQYAHTLDYPALREKNLLDEKRLQLLHRAIQWDVSIILTGADIAVLQAVLAGLLDIFAHIETLQTAVCDLNGTLPEDYNQSNQISYLRTYYPADYLRMIDDSLTYADWLILNGVTASTVPHIFDTVQQAPVLAVYQSSSPFHLFHGMRHTLMKHFPALTNADCERLITTHFPLMLQAVADSQGHYYLNIIDTAAGFSDITSRPYVYRVVLQRDNDALRATYVQDSRRQAFQRQFRPVYNVSNISPERLENDFRPFVYDD